MIKAHVDVKSTDGYVLRLFCVGFTKKRTNQIKKTSYAQHQQVRQIRKKMVEIMTREVQTNDLKEVVNKLYVSRALLCVFLQWDGIYVNALLVAELRVVCRIC